MLLLGGFSLALYICGGGVAEWLKHHWNCQALYHEPLARVIAQALPVFDITIYQIWNR